jgi:2-epi-5-epi-valiolone synthase
MNAAYRTAPHGELRQHASSIELDSTVRSTQTIVFTRDVLAIENPLLASLVGTTPSLFVTTPTVDRLYGPALRAHLAVRLPGVDHRALVLHCREGTKTMGSVLAVCEAASDMMLGRHARIVALGGGVCTDVCGLAAALYCRGVAHIKIPTTLLGLIDAGIGTKNAVNFAGRKSRIGTFHPPEHSILDASFVRTLDARQVRSGMAESLKMGLVCDRELFERLEVDGPELVLTRMATPAAAADHVVRRSVLRMLEELSTNLYEVRTHRRAVDFGHTFSPYIESASGYDLLHGEAVAIDMALSVGIARQLGLMGPADAQRALGAMARLGLVTDVPAIDPRALWDALEEVRAHRGGSLHLVVPTALGAHTFIDDLSSIGADGLSQLLAQIGRDDAHGLCDARAAS